jgi:outer membrane protein OmpA-like peptidoglycan-associated protein
MTTSRSRLIVPIVVAAALLAGCTPTDTAPTTTTTTMATTTTSVAVEMSGTGYDMLHLASHPNGAQLVVNRVEVFEDSTVVSGNLINGSLLELRVGSGQTRLLTDDGTEVGLIGDFPRIRVPAAEEADLILRFGPIGLSEAVTLQFNQGGGASPTNPSSNAPSFVLGPMVLDEDGSRPALAPPVAVAVSTSTPTGIELVVEGVNFTETRIGVLVRISNPTNLEVRIAPTASPCVVVDDLGNIYSLVLPAGEGFISIPAGEAVAGTLVFGGRIHPEATSLAVGLNAGSGGTPLGGRVVPELVIRDIPLGGTEGLEPLPEPLAVGESSRHPAGVALTVDQVTFSPAGMEASVTIVNDRSDSVGLASSGAFVLDDDEGVYPLVALAGNPQLVVDANTTVEATIGFSGRIGAGATEVSLLFNPEGDPTDPEERRPVFTFGPFALTRGEAPSEPVTAEVFPVGARSRLAPADLVVSQVDRITETLREFDATQVDGGFRLTLPDSILFDFGSDELRLDHSPTLSLIAEVLAFYEDAQVIVVGHTDSVGSDSANQALSERRAQSVVEVLVSDQGIAADRLSAEGRGGSEPVAENTNPDGSDNPEGRQLNRRVEIVVLTDEPVDLG